MGMGPASYLLLHLSLKKEKKKKRKIDSPVEELAMFIISRW